MPLLLHRHALLDAGLDVRLFTKQAPGIADCDALFVDGRFYTPRWARESDLVLYELSEMRRKSPNLIYVSLADSAGSDHMRALPYVSLYCKGQLIRDRNEYLRPLYGYRLFSDYYHKVFSVNDEAPVHSEPVTDPTLLDKLTVCWNSGLADYSWLGPMRMQIYEKLPLPGLLRFPNSFSDPRQSGRTRMSSRFGTRYVRESVAFQRKRTASLLADRLTTTKLSRRNYLKELEQSRIAISPFGLGEITLRDFEIFMAGATLLKPDMSEIETWPDLFRDRETMIAYRWDFSDLDERISELQDSPALAVDVATAGQSVYRRHLIGKDAGPLFASHLKNIIMKSNAPANL